MVDAMICAERNISALEEGILYVCYVIKYARDLLYLTVKDLFDCLRHRTQNIESCALWARWTLPPITLL
jgi:hypothetical protein